MTKILSDICYYASEKTEVQNLSPATYISTENMLPNKGGIVLASSLPSSTSTQRYQNADTLVSNIRPYFKKAWFAKGDGGCSNDVLVFRAKDGINPLFLYYILSSDQFFKYATATSKGTKMPRGDKTAIMKYPVPDLSKSKQDRIATILSSIDDRIALNQRINTNLHRQASAIYQGWFEECVTNGGSYPESWKKGKLGDIAEIASGKRPSTKSAEKTKDTSIPIVGAASIMGFTNEYNHCDKILVTGRVGTHGVIQRFSTPCWTSDNTLVISTPYYEYVYQILQRIDYRAMNRGSTQPLITQGDMNKVDIIVPDENALRKYETTAGEIMAHYESNQAENDSLAQLRDILFPQLISNPEQL